MDKNQSTSVTRGRRATLALSQLAMPRVVWMPWLAPGTERAQ